MVWEQYKLLCIADYSFGSSVEKKAVTVFTGMLERGDDVICRQRETEKDGGASSIIRIGRA